MHKLTTNSTNDDKSLSVEANYDNIHLNLIIMPLSSVADHVISHVVSLLHILQLFMPFMMQMQHKKPSAP